jgi:phage N-6-adenine-methyltransferase
MAISKALYSSDKEDWETPQALFDKLNKEFHFNMDAAANEHNAKCPMFFDKDDDGLKMNWLEYAPPDGRQAVIFLNPPYGKAIGQWMKKAYTESTKGCTVVCLVHARTDTKWFQDFVLPYAAEIRFIRGRVKFGDGKQSSPFPSCLVIYKSPLDMPKGQTPIISSYHQ